MADSRNWDVEGSRLAGEAAADGEPTRWFEELWSAAGRDEVDMPWDRTAPYPPVLAFADRAGPGAGRRAVVVGAGLGADAELLAPDGELLAVQFVHEDDAPEDDGPPWLVTRTEMESLASGDVEQVSLNRGPHPLRPDGPDTWVGVHHRSG